MVAEPAGKHSRAARWGSHPVGTLGLLLLLSLAVRLPFFFPAVMDWDESTHILIGQSLLDGYLPYVQLWTLKPPLIFAFDAAAIAVLGHSVASVRLAGTLCVAGTAFVVYLFGVVCWNRTAAWLAAALTILAIGATPSGQATMTEIVLLPALMGAVYLLLDIRQSSRRCVWAGILMAVATLVRLNTAYVVIAAALYLLGDPSHRLATRLRHLAAYAGGGLLIVALVLLPYLISGQFDLLWRSLVVAPLAYANSQHSALSNLRDLGLNAFGVAPDEAGLRFEVPWVSACVWVGGILGLATMWRGWRSLGAMERRGISLLSLCTLATIVGIVTGGAASEHYLIQLVPFAALLTAGFVYQQSRWLRRITWSVAGAFALLSLRPIISEYRTMFSRALRNEPLHYGPAYDVAQYLARENPAERPVFLLKEHIAYWFMGSHPLTRLTAHPSNIWKQYLVEAMAGTGTTSEAELMKVFDQEPEFVVLARTNPEWTRLNPRAWALFETILNDRYVLATRIDGRRIFRLRASAPPASRVPDETGG